MDEAASDEALHSETDSENDRDNRAKHQSVCGDESTSSESESEEVWSGVLPEVLSRDIETAPPLPECQQRQTSLQKVISFVFWFVYFLLIWQATCHLSDNGLAWLLRFLVSWLKVFGVEISNEFFEKLLLSFPGSLYLVRQFLNLDRDNF